MAEVSGLVLGALSWDPEIRGALIVLTAAVVLPGSVYLLLATNTGARLGFLLAAAGLSGWLVLLTLLWTVTPSATGPRGRNPEWEVQEVVTGDVSESTSDFMVDFPEGWERLRAGQAELGDAQAAADRVLLPAAATAEEGGGEEPEFEPLFREADDYVQVAGYRKGGENYFPGGFEHSRGFLHRPHYAVIQVQPVREVATVPGAAPPPPTPDPSQPVTTVVMVRDLGTVRFPPFVAFLSTLLIFGVIVNVLHRRDKEIQTTRAARTGTTTS